MTSSHSTAKPTYYELLKDPRWQRVRLTIMERDDFACRECGARDATLHVHHGFYAKGRMPWEYSEQSLFTLCENCHKDADGLRAITQELVGMLSIENKNIVVGYAVGLHLLEDLDTSTAVPSYEYASGLADAFHIDRPELVLRANGDEVTGHQLRAIQKAQLLKKVEAE